MSENVINYIADQYIDLYKATIYKCWVEYEKTAEAYKKITSDKDNDEHKIKRIAASIHDEKTLKIELSNGNTVKVEARAVSALRHNGSISDYYVIAADRQYLDRNEYGRGKDITLADIVTISHGQRLLYKAK